MLPVAAVGGVLVVCLCSPERLLHPQVCKQFTQAGFMADADLDSGCLLNKKIRNAQLAQYNFILGEFPVLLELMLGRVQPKPLA